MNTFVSGESDAKGLSVILPYIAVDPAAVAIRRPELLRTLGIWFGVARLGWAGRGWAWQGKELGRAISARTTKQHNPMEQTHSNALMNHAGALYAAYLNAAKDHHPEMSITSWPDFVCDPLNKVSVGCWIAVAKVAVKMENDARDSAL